MLHLNVDITYMKTSATMYNRFWKGTKEYFEKLYPPVVTEI